MREQVDGAERVIAKLPGRGLALAGACWAKTTDYGKWQLYLVAPAAENADSRPAYQILRAVIQELEAEWGHPLERIDPFTVFILAPSEGLAPGLVRQYQQYPNPHAAWYSGSQLGDVSIEGAYIYPAKLFAPHPAAVSAAGN